jgi:RNA polymerase sigma-70 factor (ECF subfamily)
MAAQDTGDGRIPEAAAPSALTTFSEHRSLLFSIAYRMLGTVADAEDVLQDAFIRWQQAPSDEIRSPKAFLVTIVSRLCINHLQSARAQREIRRQWLPEPVVTDAASDPRARCGRASRSPWHSLCCWSV